MAYATDVEIGVEIYVLKSAWILKHFVYLSLMFTKFRYIESPTPIWSPGFGVAFARLDPWT